MLLLKKEDIKKVFTMEDAIESVKEAFSMYSQGKSQVPLRTNIQVPKSNGTLLFMPAFAEDLNAASLKIVNIYPDNAKKNLPTAPAQVMLIDTETGLVEAILDGTHMTQMRTGAATGAAFDILGVMDAKVGAMIGTGGQAATQLEAMLAVRKLEIVKVYDLDPQRLEAFVEAMRKELGHYGAEIVAVSSSDEAVEDADLLVTVTPATSPVFDATKCKKGVTVSCVGAYQHHMQEMDPVILTRASKIYFDSQEAVLDESGDILIPLAEGIITEDDFTGELGQVLTGEIVGRENDDEIIVFETVGIGTQDLTAARTAYKKAKAAGIGMEW
ncbi:MAG: ornithine cyclodeaminase family protein [Eubacterium sp.]|nr:ornithine cyclodeaminase family protein [Eubacterium sp.]